MADAFRDAITEAVKPQFVLPTNPMKDWITYGSVAGKVLAMPEMEAIKEALFVNYDFYDKPHELMASDGLPQSVIDWVLS